MILSIIAAYAKNNRGDKIIGLNNQLPWHQPRDLQRFKEYTMDSAIIMGRKTHESIGRVLPRRDNIILTHREDYKVPGAFVFHELESALQFASSRNVEAFIIGGQQLYEQTINRVDRLYLTSFKMEELQEGDAYFPEYDYRKFRLLHSETSTDGLESFRILERKFSDRTLGIFEEPPPERWPGSHQFWD